MQIVTTPYSQIPTARWTRAPTWSQILKPLFEISNQKWSECCGDSEPSAPPMQRRAYLFFSLCYPHLLCFTAHSYDSVFHVQIELKHSRSPKKGFLCQLSVVIGLYASTAREDSKVCSGGIAVGDAGGGGVGGGVGEGAGGGDASGDAASRGIVSRDAAI